MTNEGASSLSHIKSNGEAAMVDIGKKAVSSREAVAMATVKMRETTLNLLLNAQIKKGDVIAAARIAGIMAAKRTHELIPLCHPLPIDSISIDISPANGSELNISACVRCQFKTGAEMEALTAVSVAALTVYDMCKSADKQMRIDNIRLIKKTGGKTDTI